jgi:hypothetical protein
MPRAKQSNRFDDYDISVFVNCPFDSRYKPIFDAIVFTIVHCGFRARCALEIDDASQVRIDKIFSIIEECRFGIHDLSRTELDKHTKLPRFNMPLELGLFLGIKRTGRGIQAKKLCLILDRERFRYQKFMSDIAGQDIRAHRLRQADAVSNTRDWLRASSTRALPGGSAIYRQYQRFRRGLPQLCVSLQLEMDEMTFNDYINIVTEWLKTELPVADAGSAR